MRVKRLNRTANSVSPSALLSPAKHDGRVLPAHGKVCAGKKEKKKAKYNNAAASPRPCEANKSQSDGASRVPTVGCRWTCAPDGMDLHAGCTMTKAHKSGLFYKCGDEGDYVIVACVRLHCA